MLDIEYTHETIQKLAEGIHEILHIDLSTPMTLEKLTKAIIDFGIDIEYVNITDANNPLFVTSAEYEKRGCRDYVIRINKNKNDKVLLFRVAAEFGKIILYELPKDMEGATPYTGSYSIKTKFGKNVNYSELFVRDIGQFIAHCADKDELYDIFMKHSMVKNSVLIPNNIKIEELYEFDDKIMYKFTLYQSEERFVEIEKCREEKNNESQRTA